jgi:hypothetical protein
MTAVDYWTLSVNGVAALGTLGAVVVALIIANQSSRQRDRELRTAAEAQARLVRIEVKQLAQHPCFVVRIHNYGDRAIIGAAVVEVWWPGHPEYTWQHRDIDHDREPIVRPARERESGGTVRVLVLDGTGAFVPKAITSDSDGNPRFQKVEPPHAAIAYMDAEGTLWKTGTFMGPKRLDKAPTSLDPGGPRTR